MRLQTVTELEESSPIAYSIPAAVKAAGIGRTSLYELIASGDIEARKFGAKTLIMAASLRNYVACLPAADIRAGQARPAA